MNLKDQWVWITGASAGLGYELAKQLGKQGAKLAVTARRADKLEELKAALPGTEVRVLPGDMANPDDVARIVNEVKALPLAAAVLNAARTHFGRHEELAWEEFNAMVQLNVMGTSRAVSELVAHHRQTGAPLKVMMVTSMTGLMPVPFQAAYSGTKAFLTAFGMALAHELAGSNISVSVFAPGGIATEMTAGDRFGALRGWLAPVEKVAAEALDTLRRPTPLRVAGFTNRAGLFLFRFVSRNFVMAQLRVTYAKSLAIAGALEPGKKK